MQRGALGARALNADLQKALLTAAPKRGRPLLQISEPATRLTCLDQA